MATLIPEDPLGESQLLPPPKDLWDVRSIIKFKNGALRWAVDENGGFWYWGANGGTNHFARSWLLSFGVRTWGSSVTPGITDSKGLEPRGLCLYVSRSEAGPRGLQYMTPANGHQKSATPVIAAPENLDDFVQDYLSPPKTKPVALDQSLEELIQGVKTRKKW